LECMAGTTGLEPATSAVTGQRSNQLSYVPRLFFNNLGLYHIESSVSQLSPFSLHSTFSSLWTQFWAFVDTKVDTKTATATTRLSLSDESVLVSKSPSCRRKKSLSQSPVPFLLPLAEPCTLSNLALRLLPSSAGRRSNQLFSNRR
jgi:hypothetical protein